MKTRWRTIKECPNYMISVIGEVKSLERPKISRDLIRKSSLNRYGYPQVTLTFDKNKRRTFRIHRLAALYFIKGKTKHRDMVNHIDANKLNSHYSNLEWVTRSENLLHHYRTLGNKSKMSEKKGILAHNKRIIDQYDREGKFIKRWDTIKEVSKQLGFTPWHLSKRMYEGKKVYGFYWKLVNNKITK